MYLHQLSNLKSNIDNYKINDSSKYLDEFENSISKAIDLSLDIIVKKIMDTTDPAVLDLFYTDVSKLENTYQNIMDNIVATLSDHTSLDELSVNFINYFEFDKSENALLISQKAFVKLDSTHRIFKMCTLLVLCYFAEQKIKKDNIKSHFLGKKKEVEPSVEKKTIGKTNQPNFSKKTIMAIITVTLIGSSAYFFASSKEENNAIEIVADTETQPQNIEFKDIAKLGDYIDYLLPNDEIITIPEKGSEKAILDFILDSSNSLDDSNYWLVLDRIHFVEREESYFIDSEEQIKNIALILSSFPKTKIEIAGYTDNLGNPKSNKNLSLKRANSIKEALVKLKIVEDRITAKGYGEEFPLLKNNNEENRKENRRISIKIIK